MGWQVWEEIEKKPGNDYAQPENKEQVVLINKTGTTLCGKRLKTIDLTVLLAALQRSTKNWEWHSDSMRPHFFILVTESNSSFLKVYCGLEEW